MDFAQDIRLLVTSIIYALIGMGLLLAGYKLFDALTPTDMQRKIFEEGNIAVAVTVGFFMLGIAVVIHAALKV